jgi:hypothetical protein
MQWFDWAVLALTSGGFIGLAGAAAVGTWRWLQPPEPVPKWTVTLIDPDGIPMRRASVSAQGIARIVKDLDSGYVK